ncbi:MAG: hypothetical protein ACOX1N_00270 [Candidatus Methanomethylophilaceae archaeon]|jgi:hypothetical protein
MDNTELQEIFRNIGKKYKYDAVAAEFTAYKDFKVRWQRSYKWADFKVSDYLSDAPGRVIEGLAETLFTRICIRDETSFSEEMCDWVTAPEFARTKQPIYLRRSRNITRSPEGEHRNLTDSYNRLIDAGLVEKDPDMFLSWTREPSIRKVGHCSVLMKVVSLSSALDNPEIPDFVTDYVMYHELCHTIMGFNPTTERNQKEFAELEALYPRQNEAEAWLRKLCMCL